MALKRSTMATSVSAPTEFAKSNNKSTYRRRPTLQSILMPYHCEVCEADFRTAQGLRSHQTQSHACRQILAAQYQESDSESNRSDGVEADEILASTISERLSDTDDGMYLDPPDNAQSPPPAEQDPEAGRRTKRPRVTVEEIEDEDDRGRQNWIEDYPGTAGSVLEQCQTKFQEWRKAQMEDGKAPWAPFESEEEWALAKWLMTSGTSQTKIDEFLKLKTVRTCASY